MHFWFSGFHLSSSPYFFIAAGTFAFSSGLNIQASPRSQPDTGWTSLSFCLSDPISFRVNLTSEDGSDEILPTWITGWFRAGMLG